ncbi:alpha/beta fold hydrolase [Antrihabitans cavernicola]|uniref:Alpha/beta fold hydrolase n=2 Tax=Antrihabitans cavernicola TaxID=2495913 RepID=A0A5A7SLI1_9NOCA|nr:alpha/beta fold hydrolase [Spelaeibacter cavernicola]
MTVSNGDIDVAVFERGNPNGPVLILMHGWPDTHHLWDRVAPLLADRFRVIGFDNRGAGASTVPDDVDAYRIEELAGDLFAVIDAVSPHARVHVLAHDWGSVVGWEAVVDPRAEDRIASFTSVSGPNLDQLGVWARRRLFSGSPSGIAKAARQLVASAYTVAFQVPGLPVPVLKVLAPRWAQFLSYFDGMDPSVVHTAETLPSDIVSCLKLYRANIRGRLGSPDIRSTDVPVQLIVGTGDRAVLPIVYEDAGEWASNLRRRDIAARHWSPLSHPADVARLTAEFIGDLVPAGSRAESL